MTPPAFVAHVNVPVTGVWHSPASPRPVDAPALADSADHTGWLATLDATATLEEGRLGLCDRYETEALEAEPVLVQETRSDGWSRVVCPWQPSSKDTAGYPGYVRTAHLRPQQGSLAFDPHPPAPEAAPTVQDFLSQARSHLGLAYLWGGTSAAGLDCSGLVHFCARMLGVTLPRDGDDQYVACQDVPLEHVRPGDLYFFAHPNKTIHHVGIVATKGHIIHAPSTGQEVKEEALPRERRETLVAAARVTALQ